MSKKLKYGNVKKRAPWVLGAKEMMLSDRSDCTRIELFSNKELNVIREGVKTARKDGRKNEHRGFFLSPRQAQAFNGGINHETDANSVSTIKRNAVYLFIMGLCPILVAAWRLRAICRGK